jgi:hypothetical protein
MSSSKRSSLSKILPDRVRRRLSALSYNGSIRSDTKTLVEPSGEAGVMLPTPRFYEKQDSDDEGKTLYPSLNFDLEPHKHLESRSTGDIDLCEECNLFFITVHSPHQKLVSDTVAWVITGPTTNTKSDHINTAQWLSVRKRMYVYSENNHPPNKTPTCPICKLVWLLKDDQPETREIFFETNPGGRSEQIPWEPCHLQIQFEEDGQVQHSIEVKFEHDQAAVTQADLNTDICKVLERRELSTDNSTDSDFAFDLAQAWLNVCIDGHFDCKLGLPFLPARVIDVGSEHENRDPFLYEVKRSHIAKYLALSYCWGSNQAFRTTSENLEDYRRAIPLQSMPQTYRDAVVVARRFGIQYLWIDALCIIQDNFEDWETHSADMGSIYRNATFTIANLHAKGVEDGLFVPRNGFKNHSFRFKYPTSSCASRKQERDVWTAIPVAVPSKECPLLSRGWTYQEQLLSPRILYYGSEGIRFHCTTTKATERHPFMNLGQDRESRFQQQYLIRETKAPNRKSSGAPRLIKSDWHEVLEEYTSRELTKKTDRLVAILGVQKLMSLQKFDINLVGSLERDLLWSTNFSVPKDKLVPKRQTLPIAPSWSWGSVANQVQWPGSGEAVRWTSAIIDTTVQGTPSKCSGWLEIEGVVRFGYTVDSELKGSSRIDSLMPAADGTEESKSRIFDAKWVPDEEYPSETKILFLEIGRTMTNPSKYKLRDTAIICLGLIEKTSGSYVRAGLATFPLKHELELKVYSNHSRTLSQEYKVEGPLSPINLTEWTALGERDKIRIR